MSTKRRTDGGTSRNNTVVHAGLRSEALCWVIRGRILLSLSLAFVAYQSLVIGYEMIKSDSAQKAVLAERVVEQQREKAVESFLFEWGNLKATASSFGAVIMMSSVLFGVLAYMGRPQLSLRPVQSEKCKGRKDAAGNVTDTVNTVTRNGGLASGVAAGGVTFSRVGPGGFGGVIMRNSAFFVLASMLTARPLNRFACLGYTPAPK